MSCESCNRALTATVVHKITQDDLRRYGQEVLIRLVRLCQFINTQTAQL